jgi:pyrimidine operon attenuation protein/uracil phosphoribosyltransferase
VHFDARALRSTRAQEAVVMHPLPRTDELAYELDTDPRAVYFEQAAAGVPVRMALIAWLLDHAGREQRSGPAPAIVFKSSPPPQCVNAACITRHESAYLVPRFRIAHKPRRSALALRCDFCERELRVEYVGHATTRRFYHFDESLNGYVRQWIEEGSLAVFESVKEAEERGYEPYKRGPQREIMDADEIEKACRQLAAQVAADVVDPTALALVGVISRGAWLALRLRDLIEGRTGVRPACAAVDAYARDVALTPLDERIERFSIDDREVVLIDDVINSGWTVQRAMTALWRYGRPASVKLAVLIDRGHRAVPIRPNYVGRHIPTARGDRVQVRLSSTGDGKRIADRVVLYSLLEPAASAGIVR